MDPVRARGLRLRRLPQGQGRLQLWAAGGLWLLFFPNALYIVTDFKWLKDWAGAPIWYDIVLVSSAAWCGLLLGFTSLYLMQGVVRDAFGAARAWAFALATLALGAFGVYLGRFERWNSWDVFTRPGHLVQSLLPHIAHPQDHPKALAVMVLFTAFLAMSYLVFYAFAQPEAEPLPVAIARRRSSSRSVLTLASKSRSNSTVRVSSSGSASCRSSSPAASLASSTGSADCA